VSLSLGADTERCDPVLVFRIDSGEIEGINVSGLTVIAVADTPRVMSEGNWRIGMLIDDQASDEQAEKLGAVFGGQLGGPMEGVAPLIGEQLGVERVPIEFMEDGLRHSVRSGDTLDIEVEDIVPFGAENGEPVRWEGVFHPASSTLTVAKATRSKANVFGLKIANEGKSAFSTTFSWSA
jgi:hypothetical protein